MKNLVTTLSFCAVFLFTSSLLSGTIPSNIKNANWYFQANDNTPTQIDSLIGLNKFSEAIELANSILLSSNFSMNNTTTEIADVFISRSEAEKALGKNQEAFNSIQQAINIYEKNIELNAISLQKAFHLSSDVARYFDLNTSIKASKKAITLHRKYSNETSKIGIAKNQSLIGFSYVYLNKMEKGKVYLDSAMVTLEQEVDTVALSEVYTNLALYASRIGDFEMAVLYDKKGLEIAKTMTNNPLTLSIAYNNLANNQARTDEYKEGILNFEESIKYCIIAKGEGNFDLSYIYHGMAFLYSYMKNQEKAIEYFLKHISIKEEYKHVISPYVLIALGECYNYTGQNKLALDYYKQALKNCHPGFGELKDQEYKVNVFLGQWYLQNKDRQKAIEYFKLAKSKLGLDQMSKEDLLQEVSYDSEKQLVFQYNANAFLNMYLFENNTAALEQAKNEYLIGIEMLKKLKQQASTTKSFQNSFKHFYPFVEGLTKVYYELYKSNKSFEYLDKAFQLAEWSKSIFSIDMLRHSEKGANKKFDNAHIEQEKKIAQDINRIEQKIIDLKKGNTQTNDSKIVTLNNELNQLNNQRLELLKKIKEKKADDHSLVFEFNKVSIENIKQKMLQEDQSLVEYFIGDTYAFAFVISKDKVDFIELDNKFPLAEHVSTIRKSIDNKVYMIDDPKSDQFMLNSLLELNSYLIKPLGELHSKLIIIPDGILAYLPFGLLISQPMERPFRWQSGEFLIKKHLISYNFSVSIWERMLSNKSVNTKILAFAPSFPKCSFKNNLLFKDSLCHLAYSIKEVKTIDKNIGVKLLLDGNATIDNYYKLAPKYGIQHYSTHAQIYPQHPDQSFLAFTSKTSNDLGRKLFMKDILATPMPCEMVVLSACDTGVGELKKGSGIMSIARCFAYAGSKSLVSSLWKANDKSSFIIMNDFYINLKKGLSKTEALHTAKLNYLTTSKDQSHPAYWASYINIGDTGAIKFERTGFNYFYLLIGLSILLLVGFFFRKTL